MSMGGLIKFLVWDKKKVCMGISLEEAYSSLFAFVIYWHLVAYLGQKLKDILCPQTSLQSSVIQTILTNLN